MRFLTTLFATASITMFIRQTLFSVSFLFSTAYLLSADTIQFERPKLVDTLQNLCETTITANITTLSNSPYNSIRSKQIAQCMQNKLIHIQPEAMPAYVNELPLVMQLELLDATHTYERKNGNDAERKKFFAQLATSNIYGHQALLRTILGEIGRLHAEKLEQSIERDPETGQKKIFMEKDVTWKTFPYQDHLYNKQIRDAYLSVAEVELSPTMIVAPPFYINLFYELKSEISAESLYLPIKILKFIGWQKFDAVNEWACNEMLDDQSRKVTVEYDSLGESHHYITYPCDAEFGTTFGDCVANLFKIHNYCRSEVTKRNFTAAFNSRSITHLSIACSAELRSPRACEWINSTLANKIIAEKEKTNATVASE